MTREQWIAEEFARLQTEYPDDFPEVLQEQAEDNASRYYLEAPKPGKYQVGQTVLWAGEPVQYRGQHDGPDGNRYACVIPDNGMQVTVPLNDIRHP